MKNIFKSILLKKIVEGVIFFSDKGKILFTNVSSLGGTSEIFNPPDPDTLSSILQNVKKVKEAELYFENRNIYLRFVENGIIMILLSKNSNSSVIRLMVESIMFQVEQFKEPKGLKKLFKRKNN